MSSGVSEPQAEEARPAASLATVMLRPTNISERNQRNVLIDGIGVGLVGGVGSFLSVFLVRLGASSFTIGLLTSMPALTGIAMAIPVGDFLSRRRQIVPWFSRSRLLVLLSYALTGLVPFLFATHRPEAIILIFAAATLPQTIVAVAFTVVMGRVAGAGGRYTLMSRRWSILGLSSALATVAAGQALRHGEFPLNYQLVFIASALGGLISYIFSSSVKLEPVVNTQPTQSLIGMLRTRGRTLAGNRAFLRFVAGQFVLRWGVTMSLPLLPIYWVRNVNASDASISAINSIQTFTMMLAYFLWARFSQRRGQRWVLLAATLGTAFYPLLTALTRSASWLVVWASLAGFFAAGVDLVVFDILLSTCPTDHQPAYIGIYQTTLNVAVFLAPLMGTALAEAVGIVPALIAGTVLRLAGFALLAVLKVGAAGALPGTDGNG
jgi:hypothetical protein